MHVRLGALLAIEMWKKSTPLSREAHLEVKGVKMRQFRNTFGSCDVENVHALVARSTFGSENAKITARSGDLWKLRCEKCVRHFGAKHVRK